MKFIPTKIHAIVDYLMVVVLIIAPWVLNFDRGGAETWIPVILGTGALLYSLCTDYELGPVKKIPMGVHLNLDIISGIFLAVSPWLFGFAEYVYLPHLILGIFEIGAALMTKKVPEYSREHSGRTHHAMH